MGGVPTAAARLGNLPTGAVAVSPAIVPILNLFPLPNGPNLGGGVGQLVTTATQQSHEDFASARIDRRGKPCLPPLRLSDDFFGRRPRDQPAGTSASPGAWLSAGKSAQRCCRGRRADGCRWRSGGRGVWACRCARGRQLFRRFKNAQRMAGNRFRVCAVRRGGNRFDAPGGTRRPRRRHASPPIGLNFRSPRCGIVRNHFDPAREQAVSPAALRLPAHASGPGWLTVRLLHSRFPSGLFRRAPMSVQMLTN